MSATAGDWAILGQAIGIPAESLIASLGVPAARREVGDDLWLIFRAPGLTLRVRCDARPGSQPVHAWTLSLEAGPPTLREAAEPFGLWPACQPDVEVDSSRPAPPIRRAVPGSASGCLHTFTAAVSAGRIRRLALFDEAPDWL